MATKKKNLGGSKFTKKTLHPQQTKVMHDFKLGFMVQTHAFLGRKFWEFVVWRAKIVCSNSSRKWLCMRLGMSMVF